MIHENQPIFLQFYSIPCTCGMDGESGLLLHTSSVVKLMKSSDFGERTPRSVMYTVTYKRSQDQGKVYLSSPQIHQFRESIHLSFVQIKNIGKIWFHKHHSDFSSPSSSLGHSHFKGWAGKHPGPSPALLKTVIWWILIPQIGEFSWDSQGSFTQTRSDARYSLW